jgi:hypothetical protein
VRVVGHKERRQAHLGREYLPHQGSGRGSEGKTFDEEACEVAARGKHDHANAELICPSCVDTFAIGDNVETQCQSPSGRFLN